MTDNTPGIHLSRTSNTQKPSGMPFERYRAFEPECARAAVVLRTAADDVIAVAQALARAGACSRQQSCEQRFTVQQRGVDRKVEYGIRHDRSAHDAEHRAVELLNHQDVVVADEGHAGRRDEPARDRLDRQRRVGDEGGEEDEPEHDRAMLDPFDDHRGDVVGRFGPRADRLHEPVADLGG